MRLEPLAYHRAFADWLETELKGVWDWFRSNSVRAEQVASVRLELLKTTYRLEPGSATPVYEAAQRAAEALELPLPITIYQSQRSMGMNAALVPMPHEVHVVLHGPVTETLDDRELTALFGHELAHSLLWSGWDSRYLTAWEVLAALANDPAVAAAHAESSRRYQLYTELFCDRGSMLAVGDMHTAVAALVKIETGLRHVDAASYLRQAEEILQTGIAASEQDSHPECFLRARGLELWQERGSECDADLQKMIEGPFSLRQLDLLNQSRLQSLTRRILDQLLAHRWMQTDSMMAHARLFFDDYGAPQGLVADSELAEALAAGDDSVADYVCFLMLDFCTADVELEEAPLAEALGLAEHLRLADRFDALVRKELKLKKKQIDLVRRTAPDLVARAEQSMGTE
ncbi:MAG: M48 family metalloprotease [Planctomycetaceae bacterium]|nr:M48 family metalloprotease [Planctomycetaceae bacterium]